MNGLELTLPTRKIVASGSIVEADKSDPLRQPLVPYQRQTQRQRNPRYEASKAWLGVKLIDGFRAHAPLRTFPILRVPFVFWLAIEIPVAKSTGHPPKNGGDYDNYVKAFMDAAKSSQAIKDDNPFYFRGMVEHEGTPSAFYPTDSKRPWRYHWAMFALDV